MAVATDDKLARYRELFRAEEQERADYQETEAQERQAQAQAARQTSLKSVAANVRAVLGGALDGWRVCPPTDQTAKDYVFLVPGFFPSIGVRAEWMTTGYGNNGYAVPHVRLNWAGPGPYHCILPGASVEECERELMRIVVPWVDRIEEDARRAEEDRQFQAAREELEARAQARLAELVADAEAWRDQTIADLERRYGWPSDRTLTVYQLEWMMGYHESGEPITRTVYALDQVPADDGSYRVIGRDGVVKTMIHSQGAIVATEAVWGAASHQRGWAWNDLSTTVRVERSLLVATDAYNRYGNPDDPCLTGPKQEVWRLVMVPCRALRGLLGLDTGDPRDIRDDVTEDLRPGVTEATSEAGS